MKCSASVLTFYFSFRSFQNSSPELFSNYDQHSWLQPTITDSEDQFFFVFFYLVTLMVTVMSLSVQLASPQKGSQKVPVLQLFHGCWLTFRKSPHQISFQKKVTKSTKALILSFFKLQNLGQVTQLLPTSSVKWGLEKKIPLIGPL